MACSLTYGGLATCKLFFIFYFVCTSLIIFDNHTVIRIITPWLPRQIERSISDVCYSGPRKNINRVKAGLKRHHKNQTSRVAVWRSNNSTKNSSINDNIGHVRSISQSRSVLRTYARKRTKNLTESEIPAAISIKAEPITELHPIGIDYPRPDPEIEKFNVKVDPIMSDIFGQSPPKEYDIKFMEDEKDLKYELESEEFDDDDDDEFDWSQPIHSLAAEPEEMLDEKIDIDEKPFYSMDSDFLSQPLSPRRHRHRSESPNATTKTRDRTIVVFREFENMAPDQEIIQQIGTSSLRGRDQFRTRGSRLRGGNRGKWQRVAASHYLSGTSRWQRGERVIEICLNDEDVPQKLREMVYELEAARLLRSAQQTRKRRNVRANHEEYESDDEYYETESFMAQELFGEDKAALKFQWSPMGNFNGRREIFEPIHTGPSSKISCAYEAFRKFWDDDILEHIVRETNRYAQDLKSSSEFFAYEWYETNVHEILILFLFWIMLGIIRMPSTKSCFSTNSLLKTGIFRILMTEKRYWFLNKALHFVDNATRTSRSSKLFCLGPITEHLNKKFMEAYVPGQDLVINESLTLWKGDLSLRQNNIKSRAVCFDLKTIELCDSTSGYLWSFSIYTGNDRGAPPSKLPKSIEVVIQLIKPLLNKGYRLFADNWAISPILARFLKRNRTDCVGPLRDARRNVPAIIQEATIPEGSCLAQYSGDVVVMAYQDKNPVYTISTCHGTESVNCDSNVKSSSSPETPAMIVDYNKFIGEIHKKDQILESFLLERKKGCKWYKKLFKRLLNVSVFNSRILVEKATGDDSNELDFRLELVNQIIKRHLSQAPHPKLKNYNHSDGNLPVNRLVGAGVHFIVRTAVPADEQRTYSNNRTSKNRRCCMWCMAREKQSRRTVYMCDWCEVPLCLEGCFKKFHTVP